MRNRCAAAVLLLCGVAFAQTEQTRVLAFAHIQGAQAQEFVNAVRSLGEVRNVSADLAARTLTVAGTADQIALAAWMLGELDKPGGARPAAFAVRDTEFADPRNPAVKVLYPVHLSTPQQLQEAVNGIRSLAEIQRVVALAAAGAIVFRATREQADFGEWLLRETDAAASGAAPRETHRYMYPDTLLRIPERRSTAVRVYQPVVLRAPFDLQEAVNILRSIAEVQRAVAFSAGPGIAIRGQDPQAELTDWLMRELDQPGAGAGSDQYPGSWPNGDVVRVFFPANRRTAQALMDAVNLVRESTGIQRAAMSQHRDAVIVRGTADQVAKAAAVLR